MAGKMLPGAVEEGLAQCSMRRSTLQWAHLMRLFVEDIIIVRCQLGFIHKCLIETKVAGSGRSWSFIRHRHALKDKLSTYRIEGRRPTHDQFATTGDELLQFRLERCINGETIGQHKRLVVGKSGRRRVKDIELDGSLQEALSRSLHIVAMTRDAQA